MKILAYAMQTVLCIYPNLLRLLLHITLQGKFYYLILKRRIWVSEMIRNFKTLTARVGEDDSVDTMMLFLSVDDSLIDKQGHDR